MKGVHATLVVFVALVVVVEGACYARVNQVGFMANKEKTAYLLSSSSVPSSTPFFIRDSSGAAKYQGKVGTSIGSWSTAFPHVYLMSFTSLRSSGDYSVDVGGCRGANFSIRSDAKDLYGGLLSHALFFFQAQRDGSDVNGTVLERKPSHLTDKQAYVYKTPVYKDDELQGNLEQIGGPIDVLGGWFDAGDYLKFVETASYVVDIMLIAVRNHPSLFQTGGPADFTSEAKRGIDWLAKMWDSGKKILYYQVGIGDGNSHITGDHDLWRLPQKDDELNVKKGDPKYYVKYRPVFSIQHPISPNLAGRVAAAFALCYQVFKSSDSQFASSCLSSAESIYAAADTTPGKLVTAAPYDFYPETEWRDDMELGAIELYYATKAAEALGEATMTSSTDYLSEASHWAEMYIKQEDADIINLYDVGGLAHYELFNALPSTDQQENSVSSVPMAITREKLVQSISELLDEGVAYAKKDPFHFSDQYDSGDDLVPHAFGFTLLANLFKEMSGADAKSYSQWEDFQFDWIFGANAWGTSFVAGIGAESSDTSIFPFCMQHQVANLIGSLNGRPPLLYGGVVDGPSQTDNFNGLGFPDGARKCPPKGGDAFAQFSAKGVRYEDNVVAWPSVEPADDYTVTGILLFARYIDGK